MILSTKLANRKDADSFFLSLPKKQQSIHNNYQHPEANLCGFDAPRREKAHENHLTVLRDTAEQNMTTLRQTNKRKVQELNAEIQRFEIEMKEMEEVENMRSLLQSSD